MKRELSINGKQYRENELLAYCQRIIENSLLEWEKDYCRFIQEWLNDENYIVAQTSGSTGTPKQMRLSKEKMLNSASLTGEFFGFKKGQRVLLCLSTNYIAGKMMLVRAFLWGLDLIPVAPDGHPLKNLDEDIDFAAMIPLQVKNSISECENLNRVKQLLIGGGAVDSVLADSLQPLQTECFSSYGMTETVSHVAIKKLNGAGKSENFIGLGDVKFSLDKRGCLCIEAPQIVDEPLITNDVVDLISENEFCWLGRFDHVVNSGGIKLFPEQIEKKLEAIVEEEFFLAGVPDHHLGQKLVLLIEKADADEGFKLQLNEKMKSLLAKYEQAREIFFVPQFKRTPTGKIQREATLSLFKYSK